jgi:ketosteroid isomerase-like protein
MQKLLPCFLLLFACTNTPADQGQQAATEIRTADSTMSAQAEKEGFHKTLLRYADEQVVKYEDGLLPVIGKAALTDFFKAQGGDTKAISWKPFKAEAAASGDLGYTLGYWKFSTPDTTLHGNYYTIWKKQPDGAWKFVLDGGNGTPLPPEAFR